MRKRKYQRPTVASMAIAAVLVFAGCADESGLNQTAAGNGSEERSIQRIDLGISVRDDVSGLPLVVADTNDIWASYGLDVEMAYFQGGGALVQGLEGGSVDLGWVAHTPVINAVARGSDLQIVTEVSRTGIGWGMVVASDSPIESLADLEPGVRISHTSAGSLTNWLALYNANEAGLAPEEVQDVPIGTSLPTIATALEQNEADAAIVLLPWGDSLVAQGDAKWVTKMIDQLPDFSFSGLVATADLAQDEYAIGCINGAYSEAVAWLSDNPEEAKDIIGQNYNIETEIIDTVYDQLVPDYNPTGVMDVERLESTIAELERVPGFLEGSVDAASVVSSVPPLTKEECAIS